MDIQKTLKVDLHNIPKALAILRAELKRQKEMEAKAAPAPWQFHLRHDLTGYVDNGPPEMGRMHAAWDTYASFPEGTLFCFTRNLNPARLKVAEDKLEYAQERLDELNADMAALCELSTHRPYCQEDIPAEDFNEMYDGTVQLQDAVALLGVEVV